MSSCSFGNSTSITVLNLESFFGCTVRNVGCAFRSVGIVSMDIGELYDFKDNL